MLLPKLAITQLNTLAPSADPVACFAPEIRMDMSRDCVHFARGIYQTL
jgi:hypothetical protein